MAIISHLERSTWEYFLIVMLTKLGCAIALAHNSKEYRQTQSLYGVVSANAESAVELTYRAQISPWFVVQPDLQYVIRPGTDPAIDHPVIFGARLEINF
jgi:porin